MSGEAPGELALDAASGPTVTFTFATWGAVIVWFTSSANPELDDVCADAGEPYKPRPIAANPMLKFFMIRPFYYRRTQF